MNSKGDLLPFQYEIKLNGQKAVVCIFFRVVSKIMDAL